MMYKPDNNLPDTRPLLDVFFRGRCPNAPGICFCTGACRINQPTINEKLAALKAEYDRLSKETE
jgi:hypothetical protein